MFAIVLPLLLGCGPTTPDTSTTTIQFYIVSEEKIDGGRFIDTSELPKVGYIGVRPDLVVTSIQGLFSDEGTPGSAIMIDTNGIPRTVPIYPAPSLGVTLHSDDGKRFATLTERAVGRRLLVMLDAKPLTAPRVMDTIDIGSFQISFRDKSDLRKTEDVLKTLIRK